MPDTNLKVFLCHSSQDKPTVRELYTKLSAEGWLDVWFDEKKLLPGQDWEFEIETALDEADAVIVTLSTNSVSKEGYVQKELRFGLDIALEKPEGMIYILPVRLNDCTPPRRIRSYHYVDFFGENKAQSYSGLLGALKRIQIDVAKKREKAGGKTGGADASSELTKEMQEIERLRAKLTDASMEDEKTKHELVSIRKENDDLKNRQSARSPDTASLEQELRSTLEMVARLQNQLAEANTKILKNDASGKHSNELVEVIASISQELRMPLSSITGYTDLLLGESVGILGALQRKFMERIKASTERIGALTDDLIQITSSELGLDKLEPEKVDLRALIDNAMSYAASQVREKNISMHLDLPADMKPIYIDREAIQQILIHLLQNAGAASPVGGTVWLKIQEKTEGEKEFILIQVVDTGGGIPTEDLSRVFTRIYRADNTLIQGVGDTGVGLSIAKTLTEAQHGRIWVETAAGAGSTFSVLLPVSDHSMGA